LVALRNMYKATKAEKQHGRLIQKIQRQFRYCVNTPPRSGPIPAETAQTRPVVARNMPRWLSSVSFDGLS
jgi:hypothetical protein